MRRLRGNVGCLAVVLAAMGGCSDSGPEAPQAAPVTPGPRGSALLVGTPELVRDIQPTLTPSAREGSYPRDFVAVGSTRFFIAGDALHGFELWKSDGTPGGTVLVRDIAPGSETHSINQLTAAHGVLYFIVDNTPFGSRLWRSDGTPEGTGPVFTDRSFLPVVTELEAVNGTLYFTAASAYREDTHLWTTDGTREGTRLVPGAGSKPLGLLGVGRTLYFRADDGVHGHELWKSDGTSEGTVMVKDLVPGSGSGGFWEFAAAGDVLFFTQGSELWKSDGTPEGTVPLTNALGGSTVPDGPSLRLPSRLTVSGGTLYFSADDGTSGYELWKSDGSPRGTVRVMDIHPSGSSSPASLCDVNGVLLFNAVHPDTGREVWRSDGTPEGTVRLTDLLPGGGSESVRGAFAVAGSRAYFFAHSGGDSLSLWLSDGTPAGTRQVLPSLAPQFWSTGLEHAIGLADGRLLFTANDGLHGVEPWTTDGTPEGTVLLRDLYRTAPASGPRNMMDVGGGRVLFSLSAGASLELWSSDGTEAGTRRLLEGLKLLGIVSWRVGGVRFFTASRAGDFVNELWRSDGTPEGTFLVRDFSPGVEGSTVQVEAGLAGRAFFSAATPTDGTELWASDGTPEGTVRVKDLRPGSAPSNPYQMLTVGGTLYFTADDGVHGRELWKSDGTEAGTVLVHDFVPGAESGFLGEMADLNGTLVFTAREAGPSGKVALWRLGPDGQPRKIPLSAPGVTPKEPQTLRVVNGTLLIFTDTFGLPELWSYDGTSEHAALLVKDRFYYVADLAAAGRVLYFLAGNGLPGHELWRSDGTAGGTYKVTDADQGFLDTSYFPSTMVGLADRGQVLLRSVRAATGVELWASEGSEAGTTLVADLAPGPWTSDPRSFARSGDSVFFSADDGVHGAELWRLSLPPMPDTTRPVLVCPAVVTAEATSMAGAIASWRGARVSDDVSGSIPLTYSHVPDRLFPLGTTVVTVRARDEAGNEASCIFSVRVRDSLAPGVTCPADVEVEASHPEGTPVSFAEATASDGVTARPTVTYSHASGSAFPVGETEVTAAATDVAGNTGTCTFLVTVRDTTKPTLTCPADLTARARSAAGVEVSYAATAGDTGSPVTVTYSHAPGSTFPVGESAVTVTAKDAAGNEATCAFHVTVKEPVRVEVPGCAAAGGSPAGLLGLLLLLAWPSLGRARARRG